MPSASAAASTLTRPRIAIALISAITAASAGYYLYSQYTLAQSESEAEPAPPSGSGLHRRNALRRPRRSSQRHDDSSESESHADENVDNNALVTFREALADADLSRADEWFNDPAQAPRQRTGENIVTLLFRVSEDNARRNAYVHRGCQCNGCGMVPIRGIRYRCANCADFDLCEVCESQALHNKTHVFYKVKVPAPPFGPRHVQPPWYPGDPDSALRNLPRQLLAKWSQETGFERVELDAFWEQWTFMANTEWRDDPDGLGLAMDRKTFERCLVPSGGYRHATPNLIHDRMFAFYDTNHDDLIGFEEFLHGVSYRKRKDKLRRTFDGYDIDGDGYVNRRDFLRMFRAYYVLYKQMHRDILDGLDDHMMTTTEAQQLINSRQPLSSYFGREGRVPAADQGRPMEGKIFHSNGEVDVNDGKGVVNEDKPDTAGREEILSGLFARSHNQSFFTESFNSSRRPHSSGDTIYWPGIIDPPQNTVDLASLLQGDYAQLDDILESIRPGAFSVDSDSASSSSSSSDDEGQSVSDGQAANAAEDEEDTELGVTATSEMSSSQVAPDARRFTNTLPNEGQLRAQHQATASNTQRLGLDKRRRVMARKQLLERWKRRAFYLDEEEGGLPPQGWDDSQDILANLNGVAESSKAAHQPLLSPRSRSSSKVRFAEDTDDFETRSNLSTSSRSVPERWGGMEIPDAERDAGKEILYQVTQQAFNELLDEIFKEKEDQAIRAAETKEQREKYRVLLDLFDLEDLEIEDGEEVGDDDKPTEQGSVSPRHPQIPRANRAVQDQNLEELLSVSGYTVRDDDRSTGSLPTPSHNTEGSQQEHDPSEPVVQDTSNPGTDAMHSDGVFNRDPTMPQFRPDSLARAMTNSSSSPATGGLAGRTSSRGAPVTSRSVSFNGTGRQDTPQPNESPSSIPRATLIMWKRLDLAEREASERGGWGRLSYEEFEEVYREHEFQDSSRNRLDYLGSWIDFCIP
ncbi:EF-hand [Xylariomycetidae sp. FL2044]|nr:EF-hand [Xylariomycetidae sp. FL2044]